MQTLELAQTKNIMSSHSVSCSSGVLNVSSKSIKQITLAEKLPRKCWNSQNWWLKSLSLASFMKKVTKSLFSSPMYEGAKSIAS